MAKIKFAVTCSSNMNRSMEAHSFLQSVKCGLSVYRNQWNGFSFRKKGFDVCSFGTGNQVKLPGPAANQPNCYDFGTPYEFIYNDLRQKDMPFYTQNGLLNMVDRNRRIKEAPQKLQNDLGQYDVVIALEERVYDQVLEHMHNRLQKSIAPVHIINIDIEDNHEEATIGAWLVRDLCEKLEKCDDLDNEIDEVLADFEGKNPRRNILHTIQFY